MLPTREDIRAILALGEHGVIWEPEPGFANWIRGIIYTEARALGYLASTHLVRAQELRFTHLRQEGTVKWEAKGIEYVLERYPKKGGEIMTTVCFIVFHDSGYLESNFEAIRVWAASPYEAANRVHNEVHGNDATKNRTYFVALEDDLTIVNASVPQQTLFTVASRDEFSQHVHILAKHKTPKRTK